MSFQKKGRPMASLKYAILVLMPSVVTSHDLLTLHPPTHPALKGTKKCLCINYNEVVQKKCFPCSFNRGGGGGGARVLLAAEGNRLFSDSCCSTKSRTNIFGGVVIANHVKGV